jgi:hypothetical protein
MCLLTLEATTFRFKRARCSYVLFVWTWSQEFRSEAASEYLAHNVSRVFLAILFAIVFFSFSGFSVSWKVCCHFFWERPFTNLSIKCDCIRTITVFKKIFAVVWDFLHWKNKELAHWFPPCSLVKITLPLATAVWYELHTVHCMSCHTC